MKKLIKNLTVGKIIGIVFLMTVAISVFAAYTETINWKTFDKLNADCFISQTLLASQQYIDESVAGTTVLYSTYRGVSGSIFIRKRTVIEYPGNTTLITREKTIDTWDNRFSASYTEINE